MKKLFVNIICGFVPDKEKRRCLRKKLLHVAPSAQNNLSHNNKFILIRQDGTIINNPAIPGLSVSWNGENSTVIIHGPSHFIDCNLHIGTNNYVEIQASKHAISNLNIPDTMSQGSKLLIGRDFSAVGVRIFLHDEPFRQVIIGDDCMFSFDVVLWPSDGHTIYDAKTGNILNIPNDEIIIKNHVWLCRGVSILKNAIIAENSVVGLNSVVNKEFTEPGVVLAGCPAKIIKHGINWSRQNTYYYFQEHKGNNK